MTRCRREPGENFQENAPTYTCSARVKLVGSKRNESVTGSYTARGSAKTIGKLRNVNDECFLEHAAILILNSHSMSSLHFCLKDHYYCTVIEFKSIGTLKCFYIFFFLSFNSF